jgi:hypothetical protein
LHRLFTSTITGLPKQLIIPILLISIQNSLTSKISKMKKPFLSFLLLFTVFATAAFATEPISGIGIIVRTNPGGKPAESSRTGKDGKFSISLPAGNYDLTIVFNDVVKAIGTGKNWDGNTVTLSYRNSEVRTKVPFKEIITKNSLPITITTHGANTTIDGVLSYEPTAAGAPADKK